jgi:hypothetical protein
MGRVRWIGFTVGLLVFVGAHVIETARWHSWFRGQYEPWFLNSGRALAFTMACVFGASAIVGALNASNRPTRGFTIAAGAATAMVAVLMLGPGSTIFPIVLTIGAVVLLLSSVAGAWVGGAVGRRRSAPRR